MKDMETTLDLDTLEKKAAEYRAIVPRLSTFEREDHEENFMVEFTHDSTSIEGNTLTLIQTKMILTDRITPAEISLKELDEVRGHASAWEFVKECVKNGTPLSENIIRDIHEHVVPVRGVGGMYRSIPVYIRGAQHVPPNPVKIRDEMGNYAYNMEQRVFPDEIEKAAWLHADLVRIHPFQDGNGRTARLVMNYHLMANGYPPTSIKLKNRERYFAALEEYSLHRELKPFKTLLYQNMDKELDAFLSMYSMHKRERDLLNTPSERRKRSPNMVRHISKNEDRGR